MNKQTYVTCGLVGHVANGKTTLVEQLTNINTKRYSNEIGSGRTIKLGYANCAIWRCDKCNTIDTSSVTKKHRCKLDNHESNSPIQYVSFVDTPGHHSMVATMIRGAGTIDCAILITDVRKDDLQLQTLEHLSILEILGINNIIVLQNKIDLVTKEQCIKHKNMLKIQLIGTVAEHAPIIPCSAVKNLSMDEVKKQIYNMTQNIHSDRSHSTLSVIRSFDVNKKGADIDKLVGGVIGGVMTGPIPLCIGDDIRIQPGISINGIYKELTTKITSIYNENKKCSETIPGCLHGIGTKLDPSLTKGDRLVGSIVTKMNDDELKLYYTLKMKIHFIRGGGGGKKLLKREHLYKLIVGNKVIKAIYKGHSTMDLVEPICLVTNRCIIYSCESSNTRMIGFGIIKEDIDHHPTAADHPPHEPIPFDYDKLISQLDEISSTRIKITPPNIYIQNRDTIWTNANVFCKQINRGEEDVLSFFKNEIMGNITITSEGWKFYKMKLNENKIQSLIKKFIKDCVRCGECHGLNTESVRNSKIRKSQLICSNCSIK